MRILLFTFTIMKAARLFFILILSVFVIMGSGSFTIGKMICRGDGHAAYSFGAAKDCCEKNGTPLKSVKRPCCDLVSVSYALDDFSPSSTVQSANDQFVFMLSLDFRLQMSNFALPVFYSDLPPSDIKDRLYSFRSLLL
jgi:hypothetical protein